jgi:anthranilate/para-aminobenzoate synthase component II
VAAYAAKGPVVVIDNYDSFTYNLCQVRAATTRGAWRVAAA